MNYLQRFSTIGQKGKETLLFLAFLLIGTLAQAQVDVRLCPSGDPTAGNTVSYTLEIVGDGNSYNGLDITLDFPTDDLVSATVDFFSPRPFGLAIPADGTLDQNTGTFTYSAASTAPFSGLTEVFTLELEYSSDGPYDVSVSELQIGNVGLDVTGQAMDGVSLDAISDQSIEEGQTLTLPVSGSSMGCDPALGVTYTMILEDGEGTVPPSEYSLDPNEFSWTPGESGSYTATVTATDGYSSATETFNIEVTAAPDNDTAPTISLPASESVDENGLVSVPLSITDEDGDDLVVSITSQSDEPLALQTTQGGGNGIQRDPWPFNADGFLSQSDVTTAPGSYSANLVFAPTFGDGGGADGDGNGVYTITVQVTDEDNNTISQDLSLTVNDVAQTLSSSTTQAVRIEAESFDNQGGTPGDNQGIGVEESNTLVNIGFTHDGDFVEYLIDAPAAGEYQFAFAVAKNSGTLAMMNINGDADSEFTVPNNGNWTDYSNIITTTTILPAGPSTLRFNFLGGGGFLFNIDYFDVTYVGPVATDNEPPVITLLGDNPLDLTVGTPYNEPGATATDNVDGDISANIIIDASAVNTAIAGTYQVTYNVSDAAGNAAPEVIRTVNVAEDNTADPCITRYLINSGGADEAFGTLTFEEDQAEQGGTTGGSAQFGTNSPYYIGMVDNTFAAANTNSLTNNTPYPDEVYRTERWNDSDDPEGDMEYAVDGGNGTYEVNLLFNENWTGEINSPRVFDVEAEGILQLDDYRPSGPDGSDVNVAKVETFQVEVTDGILNIVFIKGTQNPAIKGLDICKISDGEPVNEAPVVVIDAPDDNSTFEEGTEITFTGSANDPEDGDLTNSLEWTSSLDGTLPATGGTIAVSTLQVGTHTIIAEATDSESESGSASITLTISPAATNDPPTISIDAPADGTAFEEGTSITFEGTASDPEDGSLSENIAWSSDLQGNLGTGASVMATLTKGNHVITATISDNEGEMATETINLLVQQAATTCDAPVRINVGGPAIDDWVIDNNGNGGANQSPFRVSGSNNIYTTNSGSAVDEITASPNLPFGTPLALFETERFDFAAAPPMKWEFPYPQGTEVEVRLYFAEIFGDVNAPGFRVFDVEIEGAIPTSMDDIDPFGDEGLGVAFMRSATVTVGDDGKLDITFLHVEENPALKAIELCTVSEPAPEDNTPPAITLLGDEIIDLIVGESFTDPGATATDDVDGDISANIVVGGDAVDPNTVGTYTITYNVSDAAGNAAPEVTRTVNVNPAPVLDVNLAIDPVSSSATQGDNFTVDLVVEANDQEFNGVDLVLNYDPAIVQVSGISTGNEFDLVVDDGSSSDDQTSGVLTYTVGKSGSDFLSGTVTVATITFEAVGVGTSPLDIDFETANTPDISQVGLVQTNVLTSVTDGSVTVEALPDNTPPLITLTGDNPQQLTLGSPYVELGATAIDDVDGDISQDIVIDASGVDVNTPGMYQVTYNVSDAAGNQAPEVIRTVNVVEPLDLDVVMKLTPALTEVNQGQTFTLNATIESVDQTFNVVQAFINYDPQVLQVVSVNGDNSILNNIIDDGNDPQTPDGLITYVAGVFGEEVQGTVPVMEIEFEAIGSGNTSIEIDATETIPSPEFTAIVSGGTDNVLTSVENATVNITAAPNLTLEATPMAFDATEGDDEDQTGSLTVDAADQGTIGGPVTLASDAAWLTVPATTTQGTPTDFQVNADGLAPGTYTATITATAGGYNLANKVISLTVFGIPQVTVAITPGQGLDASTFGANSYVISFANANGEPVPNIATVSFDLSSAVLPDMVFDPVGAGGDATSSCFTPNNGAATTGLNAPADPCVDPFSVPRQGGFDVMTVNFNDFNPGESFSFTTDIDPNSIQGVPNAGFSGAVSGLELAGTKVTIAFDNGLVLQGSLFEDGSDGGSTTIGARSEDVPEMPVLATANGSGPQIVNDLNQTITVTGTPGAYIGLLQLDTRLFIESGADPFNVDPADLPFYANEIMSREAVLTAQLDQNGEADIPVTLLQTDGPGDTPDGGLNYFMAVSTNAAYTIGQQASMASAPLILKYELAPTLTLEATPMAFDATEGDDEDQTGSLTVDAADQGTIGGPITLASDATWLTVPATTTQGTPTDFQVNADGLAPGTYTATITATASGYTQATKAITLTVFELPEVKFAITPGGGLGASTFGGTNKYQIMFMPGQGGTIPNITSISLDLSTGILPDMVFDPVGTGGDATAQCFSPNASMATATGLIPFQDACVDPFSQPRQGGFDVLTMNFGDFNPGENFQFSTDIDPNNIQGVSGAGNAGAVSGLELAGATVTITFDNGLVLQGALFEDGSLGGATTIGGQQDNLPATPSLSANGNTDPQIVNDLDQTITVSGDPGSYIGLLQLDTRLYIASGDDPFNVDPADLPFNANEIMNGKAVFTAQIGPGGTVDIPVTLFQTAGANNTPDGGLNYFMAVASDVPYAVGQVASLASEPLILKFEEAELFGSLNGQITMDGREGSQAGEAADLTVTLYNMQGNSVSTYTPSSNAAGNFTIADLPVGTYQVAVKTAGYLQVLETVTIAEGANSVDFGQLLGGDFDGNNVVNLQDFGAFFTVFGINSTNPSYDVSFDLNLDGLLFLQDFAVFAANFLITGEEPITP